ncbi:AraC family transcriptional regulator [Chryseobacterium sp. BIGb0232]|uniref:AraC family transcriptional regulator n=1 Tax=Chryseobacterium sp. BIGb0232 TaxID=2940598 RepID=UPI000F475C1A|nr:AraC family transcriptional regulator [Chryseobacterium sp. BIGb0232]MCS4302677.1 AraC-like DNA-binding protein [Chryseobacterium sp. BIGb0232]ROS17331.1 AraC family transcriptional regulator [Chryseobacterium nakagawai]
MRSSNFHNDFEVIHKRIIECPINNVSLDLFQFIYIVSGNGSYMINESSTSFQDGDLFLITPNDSHTFKMNMECELVVLKFKKKYIEDYSWKSINHIECLLYYSSNIIGSVLQNNKDKYVVRSLVEAILELNTDTDSYNEDILRNLINAIIVITARNLSAVKPDTITSTSESKIVRILNYIQANIYSPANLRSTVISTEFGVSDSYLSAYFKKQCGETLQAYINKTRLRLIVHRLKFSDCRINEIVDEFGFTDESHINKFFKKQVGVSMVNFRKNFNSSVQHPEKTN